MSIKTIACTLLLSLCLAATQVQVVLADLYKCGELWSTDPCADGSEPVKNLPAIRGEDKIHSSARSVYVPRIDPQTDLCSEAGSKLLSIERVMVNNEDESFSIDISIRNTSRKNFSRPLYVRITDPQHSISIVRLLTKYIAYSSSDIFSVPLQGLAPKWYFGSMLEVQLLYDKNAACIIKQVALPPLVHRTRKHISRNDPLSVVEANILFNVLREEQEETYTSLPHSGAIQDPFFLQILLYKAESTLIRRSHYCSFMQDSSLLYRCGVLAEDLAGAVRHIQQLIPE